MRTDYEVDYKLVHRGGLDRGEVGGLSSCHIFNTLKEAKEFARKYKFARDYRSSTCKDKEFAGCEWFFMYVTIFERIQLFDKKDFKPRMRCVKPPTEKPHQYRFHGQYVKFRPHPLLSKDEGYFCANASELKEVWACVKSKNVREGILYAYYKI